MHEVELCRIIFTPAVGSKLSEIPRVTRPSMAHDSAIRVRDSMVSAGSVVLQTF